MKKGTIYIFALVLISMFVFVTAHSQEDMRFVDNSYFENSQRVPSVFNHDEHNENAGIVVDDEGCNECHHVYEEGKRIEDESSEDYTCSECHLKKAEGNAPSLIKAFHLNCKVCHQEKKKGPIMCGECHKK